MKQESSDPSNINIVQSLLRRKLREMDDERRILILIDPVYNRKCFSVYSDHLFKIEQFNFKKMRNPWNKVIFLRYISDRWIFRNHDKRSG